MFSSMIKNMASTIASISILLGALTYIGKPHLEIWMDEREQATLYEIQEIRDDQREIKNLLKGIQPEDLIEFKGIGYLLEDKVYEPGDVVKVMYNLRRNYACKTTIQVRFLEKYTGQYDSSLTYNIPSTVASITEDFIIFIVTVRLPEEMKGGEYSYAPLIQPDCSKSSRPFTPPISEFFEVRQ